MPEKVTSLNGLKVTLEYGSYNMSAYNVIRDYVKNTPAKIRPQACLLHNPHYAQLHYPENIFPRSIFFEDRSWSKKYIARIANPEKNTFTLLLI